MENIPITNIDIEHYKQNTFDFNRNGFLSKYLEPFIC